MNRRAFLAASVGVASLAGCLGTDSDTQEGSLDTQGNSSDHDSQRGLPTVRPTETPKSAGEADVLLSFGDWYTDGDWGYKCNDYHFIREFTREETTIAASDFGADYFLITEWRCRYLGSGERVSGGPIAALSSGQWFERDETDGVYIGYQYRQHAGAAYSFNQSFGSWNSYLERGETRDLRGIILVSEKVHGNIDAIGYGHGYDGYPVRWQ